MCKDTEPSPLQNSFGVRQKGGLPGPPPRSPRPRIHRCPVCLYRGSIAQVGSGPVTAFAFSEYVFFFLPLRFGSIEFEHLDSKMLKKSVLAKNLGHPVSRSADREGLTKV